MPDFQRASARELTANLGSCLISKQNSVGKSRGREAYRLEPFNGLDVTTFSRELDRLG